MCPLARASPPLRLGKHQRAIAWGVNLLRLTSCTLRTTLFQASPEILRLWLDLKPPRQQGDRLRLDPLIRTTRDPGDKFLSAIQGSTIQTRCRSSRPESSLLSSDNQPSLSEGSIRNRSSFTARSAAVTGSPPLLNSGVARFDRNSSIAPLRHSMRSHIRRRSSSEKANSSWYRIFHVCLISCDMPVPTFQIRETLLPTKA